MTAYEKAFGKCDGGEVGILTLTCTNTTQFDTRTKKMFSKTNCNAALGCVVSFGNPTQTLCQDPDNSYKDMQASLLVKSNTTGVDSTVWPPSSAVVNVTDHCANQANKVWEYECINDTHFEGSIYECPAGTSCNDGACVTDSNVPKCTDSDNSYTPYAMAINAVGDNTAVFNPNSLLVNGSVTGLNDSKIVTVLDRCVDSKQILEQGCADGSHILPEGIVMNCPQGTYCDFGNRSCITNTSKESTTGSTPLKPFCIDYDITWSGAIPSLYNKSNATYLNFTSKATQPDYCLDATNISEAFCNPDGVTVGKSLYDCKDYGAICTDGKCVASDYAVVTSLDVYPSGKNMTISPSFSLPGMINFSVQCFIPGSGYTNWIYLGTKNTTELGANLFLYNGIPCPFNGSDPVNFKANDFVKYNACVNQTSICSGSSVVNQNANPCTGTTLILSSYNCSKNFNFLGQQTSCQKDQGNYADCFVPCQTLGQKAQSCSQYLSNPLSIEDMTCVTNATTTRWYWNSSGFPTPGSCASGTACVMKWNTSNYKQGDCE